MLRLLQLCVSDRARARPSKTSVCWYIGIPCTSLTFAWTLSIVVVHFDMKSVMTTPFGNLTKNLMTPAVALEVKKEKNAS